MRGWNRWGIRRKLFSVMLLLMATHVAILLFAGSYLFEWFYTTNKVAELKTSAKLLRDAYDQNSKEFFSQLSGIENRNMLVSLLFVDEMNQVQIIYHSRAGKGEGGPREASEADWQKVRVLMPDAQLQAALNERIARTGEDFNVQKGDWGIADRHGERERTQAPPFEKDELSLSVRLSDGQYLFLQTPRGYITATAELAVKYTAVLSIVILMLGALAVFPLAERMTKPLRRIQEVAGRIARLDFSDQCSVTGEDEISKLGESVNHMSAELKASIDKLLAANELLQNDLARQQQTDRMRRQFTANVSHDFKTPLTVVISYAEALRELEEPEKRREYCDIIMGESNRLATMVGRLLELSKLENGVETVEKTIFCLDEVLEEVIRGQKLLSRQKRQDVRWEADSGLIVCADYQKIIRVVSNLLENAVKYTAQGGKILVSAHEEGGVCRVAVENTGEGIDSAQLPSLFDSFYRADASRPAGQSYGLGLAVVKGIMDAHGQRCGAQNTETGVRFWVELELAALEDWEE